MIHKAIATACALAVAASGLVFGSLSAAADTGAVRVFEINSPSLAADWQNIWKVDAPGNGYVYLFGNKNNGDDGYAVVTESGEKVREGVVDGLNDVTGMAVTSDGIMYICHETSSVMRVDASGAVAPVAVTGTRTDECRRGKDGAVWFTIKQNSNVDALARITGSGSLAVKDLTNQRSNAANDLHVTRIATGTTGSAVTILVEEQEPVGNFPKVEKTLVGQATYSESGAIETRDMTTWNTNDRFTAIGVSGDTTYAAERSILYRLSTPPDPTRVLSTHYFGELESGADGTMWAVCFCSGPIVWHYNADGQLLGDYRIPTGSVPDDIAVDASGDVWLALDEGGFARMSGGATPKVQEQPSTSNAQGSTAGTEITASPGTWTNNPSTYTYQWQECSKADGSDCTDIPGATSEKYTPTDAQAGKYVRVLVTATNISGVSQQAATTPVQVAQRSTPPTATPPTATPPAAGGSTVATGSTAAIGNSQTMELDVPKKTRQNKRKLYEVFFTTTDVPGTVTFTFKRKRRMKTVTVPIEDGIAEYRWKTPKKWPRGKTRVTATYVPSAGSPYATAAVTDRVKVRKRKR